MGVAVGVGVRRVLEKDLGKKSKSSTFVHMRTGFDLIEYYRFLVIIYPVNINDLYLDEYEDMTNNYD